MPFPFRFGIVAAPMTAIFCAAAAGPIVDISNHRIASEALDGGGHALPIPAFSRLYGTACSTCHTAAPKLNVFGEAFRLNGYRMPASGVIDRKDDPIALGAPEWDEAWPRSIRSSDLPGVVPLALRIVSDARFTLDERTPYDFTYTFPQEIQLLGGTPLGDEVAAFLDVGWEPGEGVAVHQARVEFQDPLPGLPERLLTLKVGIQDPYLMTFGHQHIDRAARLPFLWQTFGVSDVEVATGGAGSPLRADNELRLFRSQPAVELDGLIGKRLHVGLGLSQGLGEDGSDRNGRKDFYYRVRYKAGGMDLTGSYDSGRVPEQTVPGQLLDRAVFIEHFGYVGNESTENAPQGDHTAFGLAVRALVGRADVGGGYVTRHFFRPWTTLPDGRLEAESLFARAEYLALPWIVTSMKAERLEISVDDLPPGASIASAPSESTRLLPAVVFLLRQNVRLAVEGEIFLRHAETRDADLRLPHSLWMRLDVAF